MEKMNGETLNIVSDNIKKLKEIFPEVFNEDKVDFEKLEAVLGEYKDTGNERYNFTWPGKSKAIRIAQTPSTGTLRPCKEESKDWDTTQNLYIEGDNLEVLKLLQKSYYGKVKMIYIDPPYNTGNDFVYKDDFKDNIENYLEVTGQKDTEGNKTTTNTESNGRYHSNWLNMMYPRLRLARNLLKDDGAIFISIDDNEVDNLRKICDEIFGEINYINTISCKTKVAGVSGSNLGKSLQDNIEYCLVYAKNVDQFQILKIPYKKKEIMEYVNSMESEGKSWKYTSVLKDIDEGTFVKSIKDGDGNEIKVFKHEKYEFSSINKMAKDEFNGDISKVYYNYIDRIFRTTNAQSSIRTRVMEECIEIDNDLISIEYIPKKGRNAGKTTRLYYKDKVRNLVTWLDDVIYHDNDKLYKLDNKGNLWDDIQYNNITKEGDIKYPNAKKPLQIMNDIVGMLTKDNDLVMDFFSGSASLAHSIIECNLADNYNRKFIMIQLPERITDTDKDKRDYLKYLNEENIDPVISEIGKERIRRAGEKIKEENKDKEGIEDLDIGFKVFKLDSSNINKWDPSYDQDLEASLLASVENIKEDRSEEDILYEILLKYGIDLNMPIDEHDIEGKKVFDIGFGAIIACLDKDLTLDVVEGIGKLKEKLAPDSCRVVFMDNGFASDSVKTNAVQILKRYNIDDEDIRCI